MKLASIGFVLCLFSASALGGMDTYQFDVTSGTLTLDVIPNNIVSPDPAIVPLGGTFSIDIEGTGEDAHIAVSNSFALNDLGLGNTSQIQLVLSGLATLTIPAGKLEFISFAPEGPGHIGTGGAATVNTDVLMRISDATILGGLGSSPYSTSQWAGELIPISLTFSTSVSRSDTIQVAMSGTWSYETAISDISQTLTLDMIIDVVGTAHVPDPALGGLVGLGVSGGLAWLRRRRIRR
ncbi:MAG: hypothetical protein JXQ73_31525 [Phycisphaerae bacterium]|nr:hypothetical protein [Phycisphaerae bacterium]